MLSRSVRILSYYFPLIPRPGVKFDAMPTVNSKFSPSDQSTALLLGELCAYDGRRATPQDEIHHFLLGIPFRATLNGVVPVWTLDPLYSYPYAIGFGLALLTIGTAWQNRAAERGAAIHKIHRELEMREYLKNA
jgi:hypothetical protein